MRRDALPRTCTVPAAMHAVMARWMPHAVHEAGYFWPRIPRHVQWVRPRGNEELKREECEKRRKMNAQYDDSPHHGTKSG